MDGHQEKNKRAGTENLAGIVGFGKACELSNINLYKHMKYLKNLRDYYIYQVCKNITDVKVNGSLKYRLPGNANISFSGVDATALLLELDKRGICVSAGSACNSGETTPSHVLSAIGLNNSLANSTIRTTFGEFNTFEEVDYLVQNLIIIIKKMRTQIGLIG